MLPDFYFRQLEPISQLLLTLFLGGEEVINSDDETHFTQNPTDCPQYAPGGDEFVKCRVTRDKRGLDVLGMFELKSFSVENDRKWVLLTRLRRFY